MTTKITLIIDNPSASWSMSYAIAKIINEESDSGETLAVAMNPHAVRRWDLASGKELQPRAIHLGDIVGLVHRPAEHLVAGLVDPVDVVRLGTYQPDAGTGDVHSGGQ